MNLISSVTAEEVTKYVVDQVKKCYSGLTLVGEHLVIGA